MGLETSGVNAVAQPAPARSGTQGARNESNDAEGAGGFSALLNAADTPPASANCADTGGGAQGDAQAKSDKEAEENADTTITTPAAHAVPVATDVPADNSSIVAALLAAMQGARAGSTDATASADGTKAGQTGEQETSPLNAVLAAGVNGAAAAAKASLTGTADTKIAADQLKTTLGGYGSVLEQLRARGEKASAAATGAAGVNLASATSGAVGKTTLQAQADLAARNDRAGNVLSSTMSNSQNVAVAAAVATQLESAELVKAAQSRVGGVEGGSLSGLMPDRPFAHASFTPTVQYDASAGAALSTPVSSSAEAADQVAYWVAQGVQNAEMTVDGANAERVHVSISLNGNEARVELRAEHLVTREMLASASAHLKDLLGSQGMVLSGFSVGSSGAGGAGGADGAGGMGGQRQSSSGGDGSAAASSGQPAPERAVASTRAPTGELDLYV